MDKQNLNSIPKYSNAANWLFVVISALLCLGALMVFSAAAGLDQKIDIRQFWRYSTMRRVAFVPIVWVILTVVGHCNYRRWIVNEKRFWLSPIVFLMGISILLLILVLMRNIGTEVHSSRRWLEFGPKEYGLRIQPSEFAKWITVIFLGAYAAWRGEKIRSFTGGFLPGCAILVLVAGLIGKEDFGTAVLVGAMGIVVLLIGGVRLWHMLILLPLAVLAFYLLVYCEPYRWERVVAYFQDAPNGQFSDTAYQARQSIMAIGAGGIWGCGLGKGTIKCGYLPEDTTDFIFAVIGEELGLAGCIIVIFLFAFLLLCSLAILKRCPDRMGQLLVIAISGTICAQALMNLLVVTGMAPTKGIALPFVSAGGSGLVITAMAAGVLMNIARQTPIVQSSIGQKKTEDKFHGQVDTCQGPM